MSGIEVVGLVLGVVPLLISGLEHYAEGVETIETIRNASAHFSKYKRALGTERAIFENNLRYLLENEIGENLVDKMFDNSDDPNWTNPDVEKCLRRRLGRSYDAFHETASAVDATTRKMMKYLQLTKDGKGPFDSRDRGSVRRGCKKLVFGMRIKKYNELLDEIVTENRRLNQLSQQSRDLDSIREPRVAAPDFEIGREHARSLFIALLDQPPSSCELGHRIGLLLNPAAISDTTNPRRYEPKRLRAVFTHRWASETKLSPPWILEEAEIEPLLEDSDSEDDEHVKPSLVRFTVPETAREVHERQGKPSEIRDLCASFRPPQAHPAVPSACLGYLCDRQVNRRHGLFRPNKFVVDSTYSSLALTRILDRRNGFRLSLKHKQILALNLAVGMLRLHNTPWLRPQWGRHEVFVFQHTDDLIVGHSFISVDFNATSAERPSLPIKYFRTCRLIVEPTLFALGILLIELALDAPFESLIHPDDCNPDGSRHKLTDFYAASRLVDDVYEAAGPRYGAVVKRCVNCEFDHPPQQSSLLNAEFRKKVYHGIVESLQQEVDNVKNI